MISVSNVKTDVLNDTPKLNIDVLDKYTDVLKTPMFFCLPLLLPMFLSNVKEKPVFIDNTQLRLLSLNNFIQTSSVYE